MANPSSQQLNSDSSVYAQAVVPPGEESITLIDPEEELTELFLVPVPHHPTAKLGGPERWAYAQQLRTSAVQSLQIADRIDPEHVGAVIMLEKDTMSAISTRWQRTQQILKDRNTVIQSHEKTITGLDDAKRQKETEAEGLKRQLADSQQREKALQQKVDEANKVISGIRATLGDLPDASDAQAISEMDEFHKTEECKKATSKPVTIQVNQAPALGQTSTPFATGPKPESK